MIKAEIKKKDHVYILDLTPFGELYEAYEEARAIAQGKEVYNHNGQILDLGNNPNYDHIRVYVEEDAVQVAPPAATAELPAEYVTGFEDRITYLGQDLKVKGVKAVADGVPFVLLYEINDQPAHVMVNADSLGKITYYQGQVLGFTDPVAIVTSADLLAEDDAIEYVEDYIKETRKKADELATNKNATAYFGFTKDEE